MPDIQDKTPSCPPRILTFSHRNIFRQEAWRSSFQEFEGILEHIDAVEMLTPYPTKWYDLRKKNSLRAGKYSTMTMKPGIPQITLDRDYDLFFTICEKPSDLLHIDAVKGWRDRCSTSICWLVEFYVKDIPQYKNVVNMLSKFDHVVCMFDRIEPFKEAVRTEFSYLPSGIDSILFCPFPDPPARSIDVLSIGRRADKTHKALLKMAREEKIFYVYDTLKDLLVYNIQEHRFLMANRAKRSRYFLVNPGKIDTPEETGGQREFGYRYFEGAAPGTIMIGDNPNNKQFDKIFTWPDAVIHMPFDSDDIGSIIRELDNDPERNHRVRIKNMVESLLHHDWAYRWEEVLRIAGLEPLPALRKRQGRLRALAEIVADS